MRFSSILSALALAASALAGPNEHNSFNLPPGTMVATAGQPLKLSWGNLNGATVTLLLRNGTQNDLMTVDTIVKGLQNTGSYTWTPSTNLVEGNSYAIEIINDADPEDYNYSTQFPILSNVKAVATGTITSQVTVTGATMASGATTMASGSVTGSAASGSSGMMTMTGSSASASGTNSPSASRSAASSASTAASGTVPTNAAHKPAVGAAGALLAVAAGFAIAL